MTVAGESLHLLAAKAIFWPRTQALLIADVHFGKAATFRALGQPVPHGTTSDNLARLDALLAEYRPRRLIVLGDFLHARQSRTAPLFTALRRWRERHADLQISLVRGNHDHNAGDPPESLAIELFSEPYLLGPFALQHEPDVHPTHYVLAGHVHPVFHLHGRARERLRMPCFCLEEKMALLPAFGAFTGGKVIGGAPRRQIYGVAEHAIWHVSQG